MSIFDVNLVDHALVKDAYAFLGCSRMSDGVWFDQLTNNFPPIKCRAVIRSLNTREDGTYRCDLEKLEKELFERFRSESIKWNKSLFCLVEISMLASELDANYLQSLYNRCISDKLIREKGSVSVTVHDKISTHSRKLIRISVHKSISQSLVIVLEEK